MGSGSGDSGEASPGAKVDRLVDRVDRIQRRVPALAVAFGVKKKYSEDHGGDLAMLVAYKGFFSIIPLLLAMVNVLGLALRNNPSLRMRIVGSTVSNIPVVGSQLAAGTEELTGNWVVLVVSALVSIWSGLGLLSVIGTSINQIWDVSEVDRPGWFSQKLRCVASAVLVGVLAVVSGSGWRLESTGLPTPVRVSAAALFPIFAGGVGYLGLHLILCVRKVPLRLHWPGVVATALAWWGMFELGGAYIERVVTRSSDTYGAFAVVLGLLSWSYLLGVLYIYSVTLAAVLAGRRWPRSLSGRDLTDADLVTLKAILTRQVTVPGVEVSVAAPDHVVGNQ